MIRAGRSGSDIDRRFKESSQGAEKCALQKKREEKKMIESVNVQTATSSQPGTVSRKSAEEKIETSVGEPHQPSPDLLVEGEHFLEELEGEAPCSDLTIEDAIDVLQKLEIATGNFDQSSGEIALQQGKILNALKKQLQLKNGKKRFGWTRWAESNVKFIGKRKMQNLMHLGERDFLHPYAALGVERLLKLLRVTKGRSESDPVGSFLLDHDIHLPDNGIPLSVEIKANVDKAIASSRTRKSGQDSAGSIVEKFNRAAHSIEGQISSIMESQDLISQVDREKVASLKDKLVELESLIPA
jgi:hypothetical protein